MELPDWLLDKAREKMEPYHVEGFVLGQGNENAEVVIVGEAPGENEAVKGEPFIGRAGDELDKQLAYVGLKREDIYITSAVRSRPYKWVKTNKGGERKANRKPNKKEVLAHAPILDYQLEKLSPSLIITLGGVAYERLTGRGDKLADVLGQVIETPIKELRNEEYRLSYKSFSIFPMYHPAAVFYNPKIKGDIYASLDNLKAYLADHNLIEKS
ncbi:uracil-DNA glycosylase [Halobacillus shinanisalinarum]|uniref:Uracil-DNA glycosylase n=1 Tax=Halobacillus shinanisalinarum TaxID=2932258 RepID=A0ABY4GUS6_9BACI|nr:uracil-DNA glycosylase [Halobacillus shinanisalinarum]UOQ91711.1 uracil-DNA glycosylase [Halobacillus shinanisalinarum]